MLLKTTPATVAEIRHQLKSKQVSATEIVKSYLSLIQSHDDEIGAFLQVDQDGALATAADIDHRLSAGEDLPRLAGVVVAVKDNICVSGLTATAASKILEGYYPPYDATVISRLKHAGAVIIGKTNLDEFAMGASTENSAYRETRNPADPTRVPGGSSGGSAAAVAAGFCTAALGSDTGGSIRQPAAFCGLVGLRPTYGSVSRSGLIAMASSMDVIGPIGRTVADVRAVYAGIAGYDPADATTLPHFEVPAAGPARDLRGLKVGLPKEYVSGALDPQVQAKFDHVCDVLLAAGAQLIDISLPSTEYAVPTYYVITPAEASSNLSRYDGVRFGPAVAAHLGHGHAAADLRGRRFGPEPKRRLLLGSFVLSSGYADRYYHTAQRVRTLIRQDFATAFETVDILLTPTTPHPAFVRGSVADPVSMYRQDVFLAAPSLAGLPAISLPVPGDGLPVGIQLIGRQSADADVLAVAESLERQLAN